MSEFKVGDKVWVKCEVLEILQDGTCKIIGNYGSAFWTVADELKALEFEPVESEAVKTVGPKTICVGDRATWSGYKGVVAEWCEQTQRFLFLADNGSKIWVGESELSPVEPEPVIKEYLRTESERLNTVTFDIGDPVMSYDGRKGIVEAINLIKDFPITVRYSMREQVSYKFGDVKHDDHPVEHEPNPSEIPDSSSDPVNPSHYKQGPAETIDIIEAAIEKAPSNKAAGLHWQVLKYTLRCWFKNGVEDLKKARWYLDRLIKEVGE